MTNDGRFKKGVSGPALKHGGSGTHLYMVWKGMHQRCSNPQCKSFRDYGGRGITVCKRWSKFENFLADMGEAPKGLTLDRKDNDGSYCKRNCRWATRKEQRHNRRPYPKHSAPRRLIRHNGETHGLCEWARILGLKYRTILWRLAHGWSMKRALSTKGRKNV